MQKNHSLYRVITTVLLLVIAGSLLYICTFLDDIVHLLKLISEATANG